MPTHQNERNQSQKQSENRGSQGMNRDKDEKRQAGTRDQAQDRTRKDAPRDDQGRNH